MKDMNVYSVKEIANILKKEKGKEFTEDAIRKMIKENRLPKNIKSKKIGWQYVIFAESDEAIRTNFTKKFQRLNFKQA